MKWSIIGSREFDDSQLFARVMREHLQPFDWVVSGGAKGPDAWAEQWSKDAELTRLIIPAKWALYGKRAGHLRNPEVIDNGDRVVAFWDGVSAGTKGAMEHAVRIGRPWMTIRPDGTVRTGNGF